MKLTVKLDFGGGHELKVGTFSEIARDTAFEFAGEFISSGLNPAPLSPASGERTENIRSVGKHGHVRAFRRFAAGWMGTAYC